MRISDWSSDVCSSDLILGLALIAGVVYAVYWIQNRPSGASGNGDLIRAQEGDYKVKPDQPGGMKLDGENSQALATSEGDNAGDGAKIGRASGRERGGQ